MVLVTTTFGFFLGDHGLHALSGLLVTLLGTAMSASGSTVLNNYLERDLDARMERTKKRVLPAGVIEPSKALSLGLMLVLSGVVLLVWKINLLTGFMVLLAAFFYVLIYTPLKRMTWLNTSIGAIPGAIPPMSGWAAASGELNIEAWILFFILFAWQHPHFYSIAWMYQDDYRRAGFKMLPLEDSSGKKLFRHVIWYSVFLLGVSMLPVWTGMMGVTYAVGTLLIGLFLLQVGWQFSRSKTFQDARRLLRVSILYLPVLLALIMIDFVL